MEAAVSSDTTVSNPKKATVLTNTALRAQKRIKKRMPEG